MNFLLMIIGVPVAAVIAAGLVLHFLGSDWVVRVSNAAIGLQVATALVVFVLPKTMPDEERADGQLCPDLDSGQGWLMIGLAFASIAFGAIALSSSFIAVRRRAARPPRLLGGFAAAALVVVIFVRLLAAALCGYE